MGLSESGNANSASRITG